MFLYCTTLGESTFFFFFLANYSTCLTQRTIKIMNSGSLYITVFVYYTINVGHNLIV